MARPDAGRGAAGPALPPPHPRTGGGVRGRGIGITLPNILLSVNTIMVSSLCFVATAVAISILAPLATCRRLTLAQLVFFVHRIPY
jgi:hypothetical protein